MTKNELIEFYLPATRRILLEGKQYTRLAGNTNLVELFLKLEDLLGTQEYTNYQDDHFNTPMSEELKKLLTALAGPDGKTLLKVYRIRKGLEK